MEITLKEFEYGDFITITGRVDRLTAAQVEQVFESAFQRGRYNLTVDLSALEFLASAGLRVLLHAQRECRAHGGGVSLSAVPEHIRSVLEMTGFTEIFEDDKGLPSAWDSK